MISFIGVIFKPYSFCAKGPSLVTKLDQPGQDPAVSFAINLDARKILATFAVTSTKYVGRIFTYMRYQNFSSEDIYHRPNHKPPLRKVS